MRCRLSISCRRRVWTPALEAAGMIRGGGRHQGEKRERHGEHDPPVRPDSLRLDAAIPRFCEISRHGLTLGAMGPVTDRDLMRTVGVSLGRVGRRANADPAP
jgi:hypothetical protein